jgi:hypothetical protein
MATLVFRPNDHVFSPKSGDVLGYNSLNVAGLSSVMSSKHFLIVEAAPESVRIQHLFIRTPGGLVSAGSDEVMLVPAGSEITLRAGDKYRILSDWDQFFVEFHIEEKSGESAKSPDDQSTQEIHVVEKRGESAKSPDDQSTQEIHVVEKSGKSAKSPDDQSTQEIHVVEKVKKDKNGYEPDDDFVVDDNIDDEDKRVLCYGVVALVSDELKKRKVFKEHLLKEAVKPKVKQESSGNIKEMRSITLNRRLRQKAASFCGAKLDKLVSGSHEIMMREMKLLAVRKLIVEMGQTMQGLCASFSMLSGSLVVTCLDQVVATLDTVLDELRHIAKDKDEDKDKDAKDKDEAEKDEAEKLKFFAKVDERIVEFEKIANPEDEEKKKAASKDEKAPKKRRIVPTVTGK